MTDQTIKLNGDIPQALKIIMLFIDRVGFPVLAFIAMFWMAYFGMNNMSKALQEVAIVLTDFKGTSKAFQAKVEEDHTCFKKDLEMIKTYSYGYQDYIHGTRESKK